MNDKTIQMRANFLILGEFGKRKPTVNNRHQINCNVSLSIQCEQSRYGHQARRGWWKLKLVAEF